MTYDQMSHLAQTWGAVFLMAMFIVATIYALWPGNHDKFERAAREPLQDEANDD